MVEHPVKVRSFGLLRSGDAPVIVERTDQDFLGAVLKQLGDQPTGLQTDVMPKAGRPDKPWKLYQPMHRTFYIVLVEVVCDTFMHVRLDPKKIDSAGLVIRRLDDLTGGTEAWMHRGKRVRGWIPITSPEFLRDPDPARRPPRLRSGNRAIDAKLQSLTGDGEQDEEPVTSLFVAPPELCETLNRTLLYGLVPVVSSEMSEAAPQVPPYDDSDIVSHLPVYLHAGSEYTGASWSGKRFTFASAAPDVLNAAIEADPSQIDMLQFMTMLRQLTLEFDAFGDSTLSATLFDALNAVTLAFPTYTTFDFTSFTPSFSERVLTAFTFQNAGEFLKHAASVLVQGTDADSATPPAITMPATWPAITSAQQTSFVNAIRDVMARQAARAAQSETRFQDPSRQYSARAFVRVKCPDGCPPKIFWSDPTDYFQVAAWYEDNGLPPAQIALPDLGALKNLKPTVAFKVPKPLFDFLQANTMKDLTAGKGSAGGGGIELDWICSFSLPSITICAFICLNIFLSLFDLIFHWMFFIKICIPFPKRK